MAGMDLAQTLPMISTEATGVVEATVSAVYRKCIELLDTVGYTTGGIGLAKRGIELWSVRCKISNDNFSIIGRLWAILGTSFLNKEMQG